MIEKKRNNNISTGDQLSVSIIYFIRKCKLGCWLLRMFPKNQFKFVLMLKKIIHKWKSFENYKINYTFHSPFDRKKELKQSLICSSFTKIKNFTFNGNYLLPHNSLSVCLNSEGKLRQKRKSTKLLSCSLLINIIDIILFEGSIL